MIVRAARRFGLLLWGARSLTVSASVGVVLLGLAAPAAASPPAAAVGMFTSSEVSAHVIRTSHGVIFVREVDAIGYTGGLVGAATDTYTIHGPFANGSFTGHGKEVCNSCRLGGRTGAYTAVFNFRGRGSGLTFTGRLTFIRGTGGLVGLHGGGPFKGRPSGNTYSYAYHFDP